MSFIGSFLSKMAYLFTVMCNSVLKVLPQRFVTFASAFTRNGKLHTIAKTLGEFEGGSVDLEMDDTTGIAVMTLNNPSKLNSITGKMMVDMANHISALEKWSGGKGLILMGVNGNFCSGGDLTFVRKALHLGPEMSMFQHDVLTRLYNLPLISVALIQGHTLGGGAELSTACDFRVMSSSARIGFVHLKMGLTTAFGATTRLVQLLGRQRTLDILISSEIFNAEEARDRKLIDRVLQSSSSLEEEFSDCKTWLLSNYCKHDSNLIQAFKSSVVFCDMNRDLETSLDQERKTFAKFWGGPAQRSALDSKRKHK